MLYCLFVTDEIKKKFGIHLQAPTSTSHTHKIQIKIEMSIIWVFGGSMTPGAIVFPKRRCLSVNKLWTDGEQWPEYSILSKYRPMFGHNAVKLFVLDIIIKNHSVLSTIDIPPILCLGNSCTPIKSPYPFDLFNNWIFVLTFCRNLVADTLAGTKNPPQTSNSISVLYILWAKSRKVIWYKSIFI